MDRALTDAQIEARIAELEAENAELSAKVSKLSQEGQLVTPELKAQVQKEYTEMRVCAIRSWSDLFITFFQQMWRKRRRLTKDICESILDQAQKPMKWLKDKTDIEDDSTDSVLFPLCLPSSYCHTMQRMLGSILMPQPEPTNCWAHRNSVPKIAHNDLFLNSLCSFE